MRNLSHSETETLLACQYKHAFRYTGRLTGDALKPKTTPALLREGKAWGAAVAAWHANPGPDALEHPQAALGISLSLDAAEQQDQGVYDPAEHDRIVAHLDGLLSHYAATADPLPIRRLEDKLLVAIPSRTGKRSSNAYRLECYLDGVHTDDEDRDWIVEFKLRKQLTSLEQIALARQTRWYAWAWRETTGRPVAGIIVDERLNAVPAPVKLNQDGRPSKVQTCTLDEYIAAWQANGSEPDEDTVAKLAAKAWQQRHHLILRDGELDEVGMQLVSVAQQVRDLDTGELWPVRNPSRMRCPGCAYKDICANPGDTALVDALYERAPAKRDREEVPA